MTFFNKYFKRIAAITLALAMILFVSACSKTSDDADSSSKDEASETVTTEALTEVPTTLPAVTVPDANVKYTIGVLLSGDSVDIFSAYDGFTDAYAERDVEQNGMHHDIQVANYITEKDCKDIIEGYESAPVDLICAIGEDAAVYAAKYSKNVPVIFCNVSDPIELGILKSCVTPGKNVTGVSDFTPTKDQMAFIKEALPTAKNIAAVYCATDANSTLVSDFAKEDAEAIGLEYTAYSGTTDENLKIAVEDAVKEADVIYLCEDSLTSKNINTIMSMANKAKVPVVSASKTFMSKGAFATTVPDYYDLGYNAAELSLICLKGIKPIGEISVEYPAKCVSYINSAVSKKLALKLSDNISEIAVEFTE